MNSSLYFRKSKWYFSVLFLLFLIGSLLLVVYGKGKSFMLLNQYHTSSLNDFFTYYTHVGDGLFSLCIVVLLFLVKKKKEALAVLLSFLISGLLAQILKNLITSPRPKLFFTSDQYAQFIEGVTLSNNSSFPSGHTTSAFAVATVLILLIQNKSWQLPILIAATLVGYSRIYLGQHFLTDVLIGAFIGTISGIYSIHLTDQITNKKRLKQQKNTGYSDSTLSSNSEAKTI